MDETISTISKLATQNDRWLFIATIVLLLLFAWKVIGHLVKQADTSRAAHLSVLEQMAREAAESGASLRVCIDRNSHALNANTTVLERCADELRLREREQVLP